MHGPMNVKLSSTISRKILHSKFVKTCSMNVQL